MPEHLRAIRLRLARNVRRLRQALGFSQEQLAELVGNTPKHIGQIERGEVNVGIDILAGLAGALDVDVAELFVRQPQRRNAEPPLFVANARELQQIEDAIRTIRTARIRSGDPE